MNRFKHEVLKERVDSLKGDSKPFETISFIEDNLDSLVREDK